jgi:WD40 repeat protein
MGTFYTKTHAHILAPTRAHISWSEDDVLRMCLTCLEHGVDQRCNHGMLCVRRGTPSHTSAHVSACMCTHANSYTCAYASIYRDNCTRTPVNTHTRMIKHTQNEVRACEWPTHMVKMQTKNKKAVCVAVSSNNEFVVCFTRDGSVVTCRIPTGELARTLALPEQECEGTACVDIVMRKDGPLLAAGFAQGLDATIHLWEIKGFSDDVQGPKLLQTIRFANEMVLFVKISPDGRKLAVQGLSVIAVCSVDTGEVLSSQISFDHIPNSFLAWSSDSRFFVNGGQKNSVIIWDADHQARSRLNAVVGHAGAVTCVAFASDMSFFASGSEDATIRLWVGRQVEDATRFTTRAVLEGHVGCVTSIALSCDDSILASASHDMAVLLWHTPTGRQIRRLHDLVAVSALCWSPNGEYLFSTSKDGHVCAWSSERQVCKPGHATSAFIVIQWIWYMHTYGKVVVESFCSLCLDHHQSSIAVIMT